VLLWCGGLGPSTREQVECRPKPTVEVGGERCSDDPRPGRPASITTDQVEELLVATLESTSANATH
jgi:hypothetical protein